MRRSDILSTWLLQWRRILRTWHGSTPAGSINRRRL